MTFFTLLPGWKRKRRQQENGRIQIAVVEGSPMEDRTDEPSGNRYG